MPESELMRRTKSVYPPVAPYIEPLEAAAEAGATSAATVAATAAALPDLETALDALDDEQVLDQATIDDLIEKFDAVAVAAAG